MCKIFNSVVYNTLIRSVLFIEGFLEQRKFFGMRMEFKNQNFTNIILKIIWPFSVMANIESDTDKTQITPSDLSNNDKPKKKHSKNGHLFF